MQRLPTILDTAALIADTSRLTMLLALLDGRGHTATELAYAANISAQTASFHLKKLVNADFLRAVHQGRFRYFRLESEEIARWLESLLVLHHAPKPRRIRSSCPTALREARACYKHLAGRAGVRVYRALLASRLLVPHGAGLAVVPGARTLLATLDITLDSKTITARPCLDWSEREFHLAGELGDLLFASMIKKRWLLRGEARMITVTAEGERQLQQWERAGGNTVGGRGPAVARG